jgi:hypothetical protein
MSIAATAWSIINFRRRGYPRVRLPGLPGSAEFMAAYREALGARAAADWSKAGSVAAVVAAYLVSPDFVATSAGTQAARRAILNRFRDQYNMPIGLTPPKFILRSGRTPRAIGSRRSGCSVSSVWRPR